MFNFFNFISEKEVKVLFFNFFFQKCFLKNYIFFPLKRKLCDVLSQLGNARPPIKSILSEAYSNSSR